MADGTTLLPSGRQVRIDRARETIEIASPAGAVELRVRLTAEGPVLCFGGAVRMEVPEQLSIATDRLEVRTTGDMSFRADGEVVMAGTMIRLN